MEIPKVLKEQIAQGTAVLFLGAGATIGAKNKIGSEPPNGQQLAKLLSEKFLNDKTYNSSLQAVGGLAINNTDLTTVQEFIRTVFEDFEPADFHLLIPTFRWHGIVTTNYDLIIEKAYQEVKERLQSVVPIISDLDRVDDKLRKENTIRLLKVHGCITRTADASVPLILTTDQYVSFRDGRSRLFITLEEWGFEHPIVFIGHGLQDPDLRQILFELDSRLGPSRPKHYLITPSADQDEINFWANKRIEVIRGTFKEFLEKLNREIDNRLRSLSSVTSVKHPLEWKFTSSEPMSQEVHDFVVREADFLYDGMPVGDANPTAFYRGFDLEWAGIAADLDVRREMLDKALMDIILTEEIDRPTMADFYVIKAEAGSGKTIFLKRLAWEAAITWEKTCFFIKRYGRATYEPIKEICRLVGDRIFVFIDNAVENAQDIEALLSKARRDGLALTVVSAERINEWNMNCERLDSIVNFAYLLLYLKKKEIENLIDLLEKHNSLNYLERFSREERMQAFVERAGRQLLVALHEATEGKPFQDILVDEYNEIKPLAAQALYLSVCILNRLDIPVRAGLISRIHGIPFSDFQNRLFRPLEHVVEVRMNYIYGDYVYCARHPEIAEIVFRRILNSQEDRFHKYIMILSALNLSYDTDRKAYRLMIRGRTVLSLFTDHQVALEIYKVAATIDPGDSYFLHQRGIYEMIRPNGNLTEAHRYLTKALSINEKDTSIAHSLSELARIRSERAKSDLEKEHYRDEAVKRARALLTEINGSYGYHTILKVQIDRLRELLSIDTPDEDDLRILINKIENLLATGYKKHPDDPYILEAESLYSKVIQDEIRAKTALEKAFRTDKRSPYLAIRLSRLYIEKDGYFSAVKVLEEAINSNRSDTRLHYALAKVMIKQRDEDVEKILYHLQRSFTKGDRNYEAHFWYARYLYSNGNRDDIVESKRIFKELRMARIPYDIRVAIKDVIKIGEIPKTFNGRIAEKNGNFGYIERDGFGDRIFIHENHLEPGVWASLSVGQRVKFCIGLNYGGPIAINIK